MDPKIHAANTTIDQLMIQTIIQAARGAFWDGEDLAHILSSYKKITETIASGQGRSVDDIRGGLPINRYLRTYRRLRPSRLTALRAAIRRLRPRFGHVDFQNRHSFSDAWDGSFIDTRQAEVLARCGQRHFTVCLYSESELLDTVEIELPISPKAERLMATLAATL
jgi:hypothetical protein